MDNFNFQGEGVREGVMFLDHITIYSLHKYVYIMDTLQCHAQWQPFLYINVFPAGDDFEIYHITRLTFQLWSFHG